MIFQIRISCTLFLLLFFLFSCKDNHNNETEKYKIKEEPELIIRMGFRTSVEDEFKLMLNNIVVDEFQKKNIQVREKVPSTSGFESLEAKFGRGNMSKNVIINLGKKLKTIELNGIEFSYGKKAILITKANFNKFFITKKFVSLEKDGFFLLTKKIGNQHNPALIVKKTLIDSLFK